MDEMLVKKPPPVPSVIKKMLHPTRAAKFLLVSLVVAIITACSYGGYAAWIIYHPPSPWPCVTCELPVYKLILWALDAIAEAALLRRILWCSAAQAAAAVLTLLLVHVGVDRRCCLAVAFVALAATQANDYMYGKLLGLDRVNVLGDLLLACDAVILFVASVQNLLGLLAILLLAVGGPQQAEQAGGPRQAEQASKV
ncbi:hypothetical protein EJB05_21048 [Eragrostis curvula]|uniref:CASP-like protein n=1 Tax=Eragrostis curvula TaxID=38414 RepID=A0A5J9UZX5_9POAL|nr:hypothetical protein EJB05_21048 [Eragrostis curvula]